MASMQSPTIPPASPLLSVLLILGSCGLCEEPVPQPLPGTSPLVQRLFVKPLKAAEPLPSSRSAGPSAQVPQLEPQANSPLAEEYAALDPKQDGWQSEAWHDILKKRFAKLAYWIEHPKKRSPTQLELVADASIVCDRLRPSQEQLVYHDDVFSVWRQADRNSAQQSGQTGATRPNTNSGLTRFQEQLVDWLSLMQGAHEVLRVEFKIFRVDDTQDEVSCQVQVFLVGRGDDQAIQQNAVWQCRWTKDASNPLLQSIKLADYERIRATAEHGLPLADCTEAVIGANSCYRQQLLFGQDHWCERIEARLGVYVRALSGLAVGDINNDGRDDLYLCQPGGLPNRLFLQQPDGTAQDISAESGADLMEPCKSALFVDLDNDGNQDLLVLAIYSAVAIFQGDGQGNFAYQGAIPIAGQAYSLAAADYDNDRLLDVYVCSYNHVPGAIGDAAQIHPDSYFDANNGVRSVLLQNAGNFRFRDVTRDVGLEMNNRRYSFAASWEDFDNDGDLDLYVANDYGRNCLYRNDDGRFTDVAPQLNAEDIASGMSVAWGDYDNNGFMDLYTSNMWSSAGNRITFHERFPIDHRTAQALIRRSAKGNTLMRNSGGGPFDDVSFSAGVNLGRWAWGSKFLDLNNDGWEDVAVANGMVTGALKDDL